jgi:hypothetical protein
VFLEFSGTANKTMGWTSFTYRQGIETIAGDLTVSGATTTGSVTINSGTGGALTKLGSTTGYYASLAGGNATTSPILEFYAGGSRRFFMGDATTTEMKFQCENNAQLTLATQGTTRMTIDTAGNVDVSSREVRISNLNGPCQLRMKSGNTNIASMFHCNGTGLYLLATNNGDWTGNYNSLRPFFVDLVSGLVKMENGLEINGTGVGGVVKARALTSLDLNQQVMMGDGAGTIYLYNGTGPLPRSYNPTTWANNGYTVITNTTGPTNPGLGMGGGTHPSVPGGRSVIIALAPAVAWGELILSAQIIYTSCNGTINLYTNGGGWVFISDQRCKKDIKDIKTARSLERIMALKPKTYKKIYPENPETPIPQKTRDADHIGFLAQDVMETNPHCIDEWVDDNCVCDGDDGKRLGIAYGDINVHMVGAIQELKKQNDAQQRKLDELERIVSDQNKLLEFLLAKLK